MKTVFCKVCAKEVMLNPGMPWFLLYSTHPEADVSIYCCDECSRADHQFLEPVDFGL